MWISSKDEPGKEVLTYAMLDTQSDTSFILESTLENLGVEGSETRLSLSTMLAKNKIINSQRVNGLQVRGYNCDEVITLPSVYSRHIIPANRDHIPTPYTAMRWEHLQCISQDLMPLGDCEVGLLIGYDCSQALAPLEVILHESNGPFGQRTALGWSIVVSDCSVVNNDCDPIGLSHRVFAREIPEPIDQVLFSFKTKVKEVITPKDVIQMMELDFSDRHVGQSPSQHDRRFLSLLKEGILQREDKHYEMPLPFIMDNVSLPNNRVIATERLQHLKRKLKRDADYQRDYIAF